MGTLNDLNDPQEERVFSALKRFQLTHLRETIASVLSQAAKEKWQTDPDGAADCPLPLCPDDRGV